ncbi:MAG: succinate--CoA ligase subunit alpha [Vicinamibacteria bacterium]|nr:succinate--CoA ligase subunit alpha [Vicinamibacteria bacterium]
MSILIDENTRVVCQGITGQAGAFHTRQCLDYGTKVVAGVSPGKAGMRVEGVPVFDAVADAVDATGANASMIFVPAPFAADAVLEAHASGLRLIACITEGIPTLDMIKVKRALRSTPAVLIGPNCPGVISPGKCKIGIMPGYIHSPGTVAVISRSGTLTYEVVHQLTRLGIGQSTCIGIGGDTVVGSAFVDLLPRFEDDSGTTAIALIGEIGGRAEQDAASFIRAHVSKPVVAFVSGKTAPRGKRMGHAGAIISGGGGTAAEKIEAFRQAGVTVAESPADVGETVAAVIGSGRR